MRCLAVVLVLLMTSTAMADEVDDLVAAGVDLAQHAKHRQAIDQFKQADARRPRALHMCLIALAYTRLEKWAQAEIALASCLERARAGQSPSPPWMEDLILTFDAKLDVANVAPVSIRVEPPSVSATISISGFDQDETFTPRVIHLGPGTHTVTATVPGRGSVTRTVTVVDRAPKTVTLRFVQHEPPSRVPWILVGAGGLAAAGGLAVDLLAVQPSRSRLAESQSRLAWDKESVAFDRRRAVTVGLFAGAAIAVGAGVALRFTVYRREVMAAVGANEVVLMGTL